MNYFKYFNHPDLNSSASAFYGIQVFGLLIALLMWSFSMLGLHYVLTAKTILITVICVFSFLTILYLSQREKNIKRIDLVSPLLLLIGFIQISAFYYAFKFPPFIWDEVAYNAALPKLYAAKEYFYYAADYGPYSAFPQNFEAISTASLILFKSFALTKFLNFTFALGILMIAGDICLLIGLPRIYAILGGAVIGLSSAFIAFTPVIKNDIANGFFQSAAILMLILYSKKRTLKNSCLMGVFIGISIGVKYNSLLFSVCPLLLFLWITWTSEDLWLIKLKNVFFTGLSVFIALLPWCLNNFLLFNNPIFPVANEFFGSANEFHSGYSQLFRESFYGDINFSWENGSVIAFLNRFSSEFTPLVLILGLIGAFKSLVYYQNKQELYLAIATLATLGLVVRFGFWEPRYSFVLLVMLSIQLAGLAYFLSTLLLKFKSIDLTIFFLAVSCAILFAVLGHIRGGRIYGDQSRYFQTHSEKSFLQKYVAGYSIAEWLNQNTPKDSVIAVWGHQMFYYLDRPYFHIHPLTESGNLLGVSSESQFYEFLLNKNVSYLCLSDWRFDNISDKTPGLKLFFIRLNGWVRGLEARGEITQIALIDGSRIYRIDWRNANK